MKIISLNTHMDSRLRSTEGMQLTSPSKNVQRLNLHFRRF